MLIYNSYTGPTHKKMKNEKKEVMHPDSTYVLNIETFWGFLKLGEADLEIVDNKRIQPRAQAGRGMIG